MHHLLILFVVTNLPTGGCYLKAQGRESNPQPSELQDQLPSHYATRPHLRPVSGVYFSALTLLVGCQKRYLASRNPMPLVPKRSDLEHMVSSSSAKLPNRSCFDIVFHCLYNEMQSFMLCSVDNLFLSVIVLLTSVVLKQAFHEHCVNRRGQRSFIS